MNAFVHEQLRRRPHRASHRRPVRLSQKLSAPAGGALPELDGCALCHHARNAVHYLDLGLVDPLPVWPLDVEIRVVTYLVTQVEGGHERTLS